MEGKNIPLKLSRKKTGLKMSKCPKKNFESLSESLGN